MNMTTREDEILKIASDVGARQMSRTMDVKFTLTQLYKFANALSQPNEPVYWIATCQPHMVEVLNWDERTVFLTDKSQLIDYIGTEEEPAGYDITPLYTAPPNLEAKIVKLESRLKFQDDWLSKGVYFTTEEYVKECAYFTRQNDKIAELTAMNKELEAKIKSDSEVESGTIFELTAKCEKMREALKSVQLVVFNGMALDKPLDEIIDEALEENKYE